MENIFLNYDRVYSYNAMINWLIGERGVGKSFGILEKVINKYKKKKRKFIWCRRYLSDIETSVGKNGRCTLTQAINPIKFPNDKFTTTCGDKITYIYMNGEVIGYGLALSRADDYKGVDFSDVDTLIFDEFLVQEGAGRYLKNEPMLLLSLIETVFRLRENGKVFCLGNSSSVVNPHFDFFNLSIPYNNEIKTFKNGTMLVYYIKNETYREIKRKSTFGTIVSGTDYEKYAINNDFIGDNQNFIKKKPPTAKLFCNLILDNKVYGVWIKNYEMFISTKSNTSYKVLITLDHTTHNNKTKLLKYNSPFIKNIVNHYKSGLLFFENQHIKHNMLDIFIKASLIY